MRLRRKVVYLVRLDFLDQGAKRRGVHNIAVMGGKILMIQERVYPLRREVGIPSYDAVDDVTLGQ